MSELEELKNIIEKINPSFVDYVGYYIAPMMYYKKGYKRNKFVTYDEYGFYHIINYGECRPSNTAQNVDYDRVKNMMLQSPKYWLSWWKKAEQDEHYCHSATILMRHRIGYQEYQKSKGLW